MFNKHKKRISELEKKVEDLEELINSCYNKVRIFPSQTQDKTVNMLYYFYPPFGAYCTDTEESISVSSVILKILKHLDLKLTVIGGKKEIILESKTKKLPEKSKK